MFLLALTSTLLEQEQVLRSCRFFDGVLTGAHNLQNTPWLVLITYKCLEVVKHVQSSLVVVI